MNVEMECERLCLGSGVSVCVAVSSVHVFQSVQSVQLVESVVSVMFVSSVCVCASVKCRHPCKVCVSVACVVVTVAVVVAVPVAVAVAVGLVVVSVLVSLSVVGVQGSRRWVGCRGEYGVLVFVVVIVVVFFVFGPCVSSIQRDFIACQLCVVTLWASANSQSFLPPAGTWTCVSPQSPGGLGPPPG